MSLPAEISVAELARMRAENRPHVLLDVREDDEVATASVAGAKHVPMGEVGARLDEIPANSDVVVMCHGGTRSGRVAAYLRERGYTRVANLAGGIDAWSREIDPAVPLY